MATSKDPKNKELRAHLFALLLEASKGLPLVTTKKMFGCDACFANETIYGLIWKTGRIGLKFQEEKLFQELMAMEGAAPWMAGKKTMSHWVLVPEHFHEDMEILQLWVNQAYTLAVNTPLKKP